MPTYEHICDSCQHQWEDTYSIKLDPPKECPSCHAETARRLISLGGKGIVELTGQEISDKIKGDAQALKRDASKNENIYSNLLGSDRYESMQRRIDRQKR